MIIEFKFYDQSEDCTGMVLCNSDQFVLYAQRGGKDIPTSSAGGKTKVTIKPNLDMRFMDKSMQQLIYFNREESVYEIFSQISYYIKKALSWKATSISFEIVQPDPEDDDVDVSIKEVYIWQADEDNERAMFPKEKENG